MRNLDERSELAYGLVLIIAIYAVAACLMQGATLLMQCTTNQ